MNNKNIFLFFVFSTLFFSNTVFAEVPLMLPVSGVLTDLEERPLNGIQTLVFSIYDAEQDGQILWGDTYVLELTNGIFSVYLGEKTELNLGDFIEHSDLWLEIQVDGETSRERIRLAAMPFAVEALYSRQVLGEDCRTGTFLQGWEETNGEPICAAVQFSSITDLPHEFADGDDDTTYTAGEGLALSQNNRFSVIKEDIEGWTAGVCYDNEIELRSDLDDDYVNEGQIASISSDMLERGIDPSKIRGTAWTSENHGEESGLNADMLDGYHGSNFAVIDHRHDTDYQGKYKFTVIVRPVGEGSDPIANGQALYEAMESIRNKASADTPYLLKIEPGTYQLQESDGVQRKLRMQEWIDIEGSGETSTKITSFGVNKAEWSGIVEGANNAELRFLTVETIGYNDENWAIVNTAVSPKLLHVTTIAKGKDYCSGIVNRKNAAPFLSSVTAHADCPAAYGIRNNDSSPILVNVTATATYSKDDDDPEIRCGLRNYNSHITIRSSTFNATGDAKGMICGIRNRYSNLVLHDVVASANGGEEANGISNESGSIDASNTVVYVNNESSKHHAIKNIIDEDDDSTDKYSVKVLSSKIVGAAGTISTMDRYTTWVANSLIDGAPPEGPVKCTYVVNGNYDAYTCQ